MRFDSTRLSLQFDTMTAAPSYKGLPSHFIGGSHLEVAQPGKVKDFVAKHEGHTVISKVRLLRRGCN